ncbi:Gfo/Idh/MocA family oxidoreductase (plasmid) [Thioclava sp. 'Guangxiensis']|uniref:Gfo/Idh/MocA family protein n=1 Tax=Thioclava sp. 'Guangxiensis' TaxID=3149044 RepID=UPI0032C434BF
MTDAPLSLGLIGLAPGLSWSSTAHLPAIVALPDLFTLKGVANSSAESSRTAAESAGIPKAYSTPAEMVADPEIDVVSITVKVPHHHSLALQALEAGKHVYCEWPLTQTVAEAEELAALAAKKGVVAVAGCQARVAPEVLMLRKLLAEGYIGEMLSASLTGYGLNWGPTISLYERRDYMLEHASGANMLTIPLGHTMAGVQDVLGRVSSVSAEMTQRRTHVRSVETGQMHEMNTPDEILVAATLECGAPLSIHYMGGMPRGVPGLTWDIHGTEGDLRITGPLGHLQMVPLTVMGARGDDKELAPIAVPDVLFEGHAGAPMPGNLIRNYQRMAADIKSGSRSATSFADAVELHRLLAAIERAAQSGMRTSVESRLVPLPFAA